MSWHIKTLDELTEKVRNMRLSAAPNYLDITWNITPEQEELMVFFASHKSRAEQIAEIEKLLDITIRPTHGRMNWFTAFKK